MNNTNDFKHVLFTVLFSLWLFGLLLRSLSGLLMLFGSSTQVMYATWNDGLVFVILMSHLLFSVYLGKIVARWFLREISSKSVDKS